MSLDGELVLPADVELFRIGALAPEVRARLDAEDDDWGITRARSRSGSRVIDKDSAGLLGQFRAPTRIVDAVLAFARARGLDPEQTLQQAYPVLVRLCRAGLLVPAEHAHAIEGRLEVGGVVDGFRLVRCVHVLDDNEVFVGRDRAGRYAAIKAYRTAASHTLAALEREVEMMRRAPPGRVPQVYGLVASERGGAALICEWVFGTDAAVAAGGLRGRRGPRSERRLLALAVDIAVAFAELHERGVVHGDIHPRNVLIDARGSARIIDLGLAQLASSPDPAVQRGGVAFFFDPELAAAQRRGASAPLTPLGEQYSLASLLYYLWTGVYYADFCLERDELLRQITEQPPLPFEARSVPPWPALEAALARALAKRPDRRFPDLRALADALRALDAEAEARDRRATAPRRERAREDELLERALARYAPGGDALRDGLADAPLASINYGAAGIAYALCRLAQGRGDARLLAQADLWVQRAYALSLESRAFVNPEIDLDVETVGEASLFHSLTGVHCVRALVSLAQGDPASAAWALDAFVERSRLPCDNPDLTLGRASLLLGCAELVESLPAPGLVDPAPVRARGDELAAGLLALVRDHDPASSERVTMLGVAHGWAGLLFALLRWAKATRAAVDPAVCRRLEDLIALGEPDGAGVRWPVHNRPGAASFMDGWCNGTAGHVLLLALAHDVLDDPALGVLAERAAVSAWESDASLGTLCCGLAGLGYAFAAVHRITGSPIWLERARWAVRRAAADTSEHFFRDALYKGAVGVALLADELRRPEHASMPLFEPVPGAR